MRYGDITRGDRIVNVATGEITGEVTAPPREFGPDGERVDGPDISAESFRFAPRPFRYEHEIDLGGDRYEIDFYGKES